MLDIPRKDAGGGGLQSHFINSMEEISNHVEGEPISGVEFENDPHLSYSSPHKPNSKHFLTHVDIFCKKSFYAYI